MRGILLDVAPPLLAYYGLRAAGVSEFVALVSLSAMWGIGLLIGTLISLAIIFSLSVDVANGVNTVVSLAFTALLLVATVVVAKRARAEWEHLREQTRA